MGAIQEHVDTFYFRNGYCCAGCDHWRWISSLVGECLQSRIVPGHERLSMLGISRSSAPTDCGHAITRRDYHCGLFKDGFDWTSLPLPYRKKIGQLKKPATSEGAG
jgi:hypothetical protein